MSIPHLRLDTPHKFIYARCCLVYRWPCSQSFLERRSSVWTLVPGVCSPG